MDALKELFRNTSSLQLVLGAFFFAVGVLGIFPIGVDKVRELSPWQQAIFAMIAVVLAIPAGFKLFRDLLPYLKFKRTDAPINREYEERFQAAQQETRDIIPDRQILAEEDIWGPRIAIINDDIKKARANVIVSSDDNYLQAKGGVAKALIERAGQEVLEELTRRRRNRLKQGDIAITGGGASGALAILHPAVIDLDEQRYPNQQLIRKIVRRSLACATALGATSIVFPVLGGGTGSKYLTPWESIQAMIGEIVSFVKDARAYEEDDLTFIALYVFNPADVGGDLKQLLSPAAR